jgi:hypothetical protein
MFIKPAPGCTVFYEGTRTRLPDEGAEVPEPLSNHWHRRFNDGDVVKGEPPAPPATPDEHHEG